jgi:hypothetical protein
MLRRIFEPKIKEVIGTCKELCNELHNLYFPSIIGVNESRRMRWSGNVAHVRNM